MVVAKTEDEHSPRTQSLMSEVVHAETVKKVDGTNRSSLVIGRSSTSRPLT